MKTAWGWSIGIIIMVALIACAFWFSMSSQNNPLTTSAATSTSATSSADASVSSQKVIGGTSASSKSGHTFRSILSDSGNNECVYSGVNGDVRTSDIIDVSGGKLYGAFRTTDSGGSSNNLMVYDGRYLYTWIEGKTTGTKTVLTSLSQLPQVLPSKLSGGAIYGTSDQNIGWDCHPWLTNASLLEAPNYVTFSATS